MVKGRGWVPLGDRVGRFFGASSARAPAFSVAPNKADLFTAIQRCKLLFIKVSHSVSSEQNENAGSLARTVSNAPSVLCPLSVFVTGSSQTNSQVSTHMHSHTHYTVTFTHTHWASTIKLSQTHRHTHTPLQAQLAFHWLCFDPVSQWEAYDEPCFKLGWATAIKDIPARGVFRP